MTFTFYQCGQPTDKILSHRCQERDMNNIRVNGSGYSWDGKFYGSYAAAEAAYRASKTKGRTLAELDVKPGDKIAPTYEEGYFCAASYTIDANGSFMDDVGDKWPECGDGGNGAWPYSRLFTIVSRANEPDKPKWGPWIGWNGGECPVDDITASVQVSTVGSGILTLKAGNPNWESTVNIIAYRRRIEPVRETLMRYVDIPNRDGSHSLSTKLRTPLCCTYVDGKLVKAVWEIGDERPS